MNAWVVLSFSQMVKPPRAELRFVFSFWRLPTARNAAGMANLRLWDKPSQTVPIGASLACAPVVQESIIILSDKGFSGVRIQELTFAKYSLLTYQCGQFCFCRILSTSFSTLEGKALES